MMRTIEFVYYLFWVGVLIGVLHLADVRPWMEWFGLVIIPIVLVFRLAADTDRMIEATSPCGTRRLYPGVPVGSAHAPHQRGRTKPLAI
jgi:hypothetical protein